MTYSVPLFDTSPVLNVIGLKNCSQIKELLSDQRIALRSKNCSQIKELLSDQRIAFRS